jgi:hypothetical protein
MGIKKSMRIANEQAKVNALARRLRQLQNAGKTGEATKVAADLERAKRWLQDAKDAPE